MKPLLLILLLIFFSGCIVQPKQEPSIKPEVAPTITATMPPTEKPMETEKPIETIKPEKEIAINLVFPNGTVEENGTYFLGEFTENFTFRVEPEDARVYFNDSSIDVVNGTFTISVKRGGNYSLKVIKNGLKNIYNISIGHGELLAEAFDLYGKFKIFFEDGTLAPKREIIEKTNRESKLVYADENSSVKTICGYYHYETEVQYIDRVTGRLLTKCVTSVDKERG